MRGCLGACSRVLVIVGRSRLRLQQLLVEEGPGQGKGRSGTQVKGIQVHLSCSSCWRWQQAGGQARLEAGRAWIRERVLAECFLQDVRSRQRLHVLPFVTPGLLARWLAPSTVKVRALTFSNASARLTRAAFRGRGGGVVVISQPNLTGIPLISFNPQRAVRFRQGNTRQQGLCTLKCYVPCNHG